MSSFLNKLRRSISEELSNLTNITSTDIVKLLEQPKQSDHGDLSYPCFQIAKNQKINPAQLASNLATSLNDYYKNSPNKFISTVTAIGPFLNFKFSFEEIANEILFKEVQQEQTQDKVITIEYSSPNIAKPFHVGHLRATLIGNCLDKLYRKLGYKVESINHLGDWGTQFGFVYAGCKIWGEPEEYSVSSLVELYKKATGLKEDQEKNSDAGTKLKEGEIDVNELARSYFSKLEAGEKDETIFWEKCVSVSIKYLKETYQRMGISFDHYLGESFYSDKLEDVKKSLTDAELLTESKGALGVDLGESLGFARITTPDGRSLYLSRDIAAAEYRASRFKFDKSIYVVGSPQTLHFEQLIGILKKLGRDYAQNIKHVAFGHVLGMKTRGDGQAIELNFFLDEAKERALDAYNNQVTKRPEGLDQDSVSNSVSLAAIIFSTLNRTNIKDVTFNWDDALSFQGDTGPYLLYAFARIQGIEDRAAASGLNLKDLNSKTDYITEISKSLINDDSKELIRSILYFEEALEKTAEDLEPLVLTTYALNLAKSISKAYLGLKVIGEEKEVSLLRLQLFNKAKEKLGQTLEILGITPLNKM